MNSLFWTMLGAAVLALLCVLLGKLMARIFPEEKT